MLSRELTNAQAARPKLSLRMFLPTEAKKASWIAAHLLDTDTACKLASGRHHQKATTFSKADLLGL
jgi:hypothetical protein